MENGRQGVESVVTHYEKAKRILLRRPKKYEM